MSPALVLSNARIVDARGVVAERATIVVDGPTITSIDHEPGRTPTHGIDVSGRTVVPGLVNAHIHLCLDGTADPLAAYVAEDDVEAALLAAPRLRRIVEAGVTAVRDLGGRAAVTTAFARMVEDGVLPGPRVVPAGPVITTIGGHGHWMGIEVDGVESARDAARRVIDGGARALKVMATAGMMTSGRPAGAPQLTAAEISACVEEAHGAGLGVAAHVEGREGAANAIEAGVDSIEHGHGLDDALLGLMIERGIALVPTISCDRIITERGVDAGIPPHVVDECARLAPSLERALHRAIELGVEIVAGNDGGAPLTRSEDLVDELEVYVELGMDPVAALASATIRGAELLGLPDTGLVSEGQRADLLVVDGDPLSSIGALRRPDMVIVAGAVVDPTT